MLGRDCLRPDFSAEQIMAMPAQRAPQRRWTEAEFYWFSNPTCSQFFEALAPEEG